MDYAKIAAQVIEYVGGKDNILSAAHCATRLRLQLKNNDLRNEEALTDVEGNQRPGRGEGGIFNTVPVSDYFRFRTGESGICRGAEADWGRRRYRS